MRIRQPSVLWPAAGLSLTLIAVIAVWPALITQLFARSAYAPHGVCILWQPDLLFLLALMDMLIGLSYVAISVALASLVLSLRASLPFQWTFLAFGGFIFFCGLTHFIDVLTLWQPLYWLDAATKTLTAIASLATAVIVPLQIPQARRLVHDAQSASQSQRERDALYQRQQRAVEQLQQALASKERDLLTLLDRLQQSEAHFRMALQGSPLIVFRTDAELRYVWAYNPPPPLTPETMVGHTDAELLEAAVAEPFMRLKARALASDAEQREDISVSVAGRELTYDLRVQSTHDADGATTGVIGMAVDITMRKALEARLVQSQKMESIGRLAGGIAHDFNNLLTVILGNLELASDALPEGHPAHQDLQTVIYAADRASRLTRQLLTFARRRSLEAQVMDLNVLLRGMRPMLERILGDPIALQLELQPDLHPVSIDPMQIEQVVLNLIVNARDAIPGDGEVSIRTSSVTLGDEAAGRLSVAPGDYLRLEVHDSGGGIDPALLGRLFEPFFTTKQVGQGSGLGLSISYGIVAQHAGAIQVQSAPGRGSSFVVLLPQSAEGLALVGPQSEGAPPRGSETVLVVEDEDSVRALVLRLLQSWGYTTLSAANGREALDLLQRADTPPIDLLLTDVVMPKMTGITLAEQLLAQRPDLPILFSSGYTEHPSVTALQPLLERPRTALIHKPFITTALAEHIRALLDR